MNSFKHIKIKMSFLFPAAPKLPEIKPKTPIEESFQFVSPAQTFNFPPTSVQPLATPGYESAKSVFSGFDVNTLIKDANKANGGPEIIRTQQDLDKQISDTNTVKFDINNLIQKASGSGVPTQVNGHPIEITLTAIPRRFGSAQEIYDEFKDILQLPDTFEEFARICTEYNHVGKRARKVQCLTPFIKSEKNLHDILNHYGITSPELHQRIAQYQK